MTTTILSAMIRTMTFSQPQIEEQVESCSISIRPTAPIDRLPVELLNMILHRLALTVNHTNPRESPNPSRIAPLATVCRTWAGPTRIALERYVKLHNAKQTGLYLKWIEDRPEAASRLLRLDALNKWDLFVDNPAAISALLRILTLTKNIRYLKLGYLHTLNQEDFLQVLAGLSSLKYFVMQNSSGYKHHAQISWSSIVKVAQHWPSLCSLDIFGHSNTSISTSLPTFPSNLRTIYLADSPCTDGDLLQLLSSVEPGTLRELGLNWCRRLTDEGIINALKTYGKSLRVLTLVSWSLSKSATPGTFVLDSTIAHLPNLMILDIEGAFASDAFFSYLKEKGHGNLKTILSKNCFFSPEVCIEAIEAARMALGRLSVSLTMLRTDMWNQQQAHAVSNCCEAYGVEFQHHWSFSEEELCKALDY